MGLRCRNLTRATTETSPLRTSLAQGREQGSSRPPRASTRVQRAGFRSRAQSTHAGWSGGGFVFFSLSAKGGPTRSPRENLPGPSAETSFPLRCVKTRRKGKIHVWPRVAVRSSSITTYGADNAACCTGQGRSPLSPQVSVRIDMALGGSCRGSQTL